MGLAQTYRISPTLQGAEVPIMLIPGDWETSLRRSKISRGNVLECLERGFLAYNAKPFNLSRLDRIATVLQCLLSTYGGLAVLVYPVEPCKLASVLALEALYARTNPVARPYVLCVGSDVGPRDEFMSFRNPGDLLHRRFFPVGMLRGDGGIRDLSRVRIGYHDLEPCLIFSSSLRHRPPNSLASRMSAAIVMVEERMTPDDLLDFSRWAISQGVQAVLFVVTNPFSEQARCLFATGLPLWGWNPESLRALYDGTQADVNEKAVGPFSPPEGWLRNLATSHRFVIAPVDEDRIGPALTEARNRYLELLRSAKNGEDEMLLRAIRTLLKLIYSLEDLVTPGAFYDHEAGALWNTMPVSRRFSGNQRACDELRRTDPGTAGFIDISRQQLQSVYSLLQDDPSGKPVSLLDVIDEAARRKASMAILVRNRAARRALEAFLRSKGKAGSYLLDNQISIVTPSELHLIDSVQTLLFTSIPRYGERSLLRFPRARNLAFLAYPSEIPVIEYLLRRELPALEQTLGFTAQLAMVSAVTRLPVSELGRIVQAPPKVVTTPDEIIFTAPHRAKVERIEFEPIFEKFFTEELGTSEATADEADEMQGGENNIDLGPVSALALHFMSGRTLLVRTEAEVPRYVENRDAIENVPASKLNPGDFVVLVNDSVKKSLLQLAIGRVEKHPAMIEVVAYQRSWIEALRNGMEEQRDTPSSLLRKLQAKGSKIHTAVAVHLWRKGVIIGPEDRADIRRLGEIYGAKILVEKVNTIYAAVERLRSIHRNLAHKLRYLIPRAGVSWRGLGDEELAIDQDLNLYLEDFADSVVIEEIDQAEGPFELDSLRLNRTYGGDTWRR